MVLNCRSLFNKATYLAALRWLHSPFAIRDAKLKQPKTKIYEKNHLLLLILAVISRYGPHLMTVMIFVTQNNFKTGPGIFDRLLGFYQSYAKYLIWEVCKVTNNRDTAVKRTVKTKWLPISSAAMI